MGLYPGSKIKVFLLLDRMFPRRNESRQIAEHWLPVPSFSVNLLGIKTFKPGPTYISEFTRGKCCSALECANDLVFTYLGGFGLLRSFRANSLMHGAPLLDKKCLIVLNYGYCLSILVIIRTKLS